MGFILSPWEGRIGPIELVRQSWQLVIICSPLVSIYDANVYSTLENNINQFKYLYKNSISTKCFGDLPISVRHPRFFLQVYSLWFSKHCPKKKEKN